MKLDFPSKKEELVPGVDMLNPVIKNYSISDVVLLLKRLKMTTTLKESFLARNHLN